jgi:hypothetical protein
MGFVFTVFAPEVFQGKDDCPEGLGGTLRDNYLLNAAAPERERLLRKENQGELDRLWKTSSFGPSGTNVCTAPETFFPRPIHRTVKGKVSYGLNLDDNVDGMPSEGCAHENFSGVDGAPGVDNQLYRVVGCMPSSRGAPGVPSEGFTAMNQFLATGEWTIVMLLRGVDSLESDDNVEILLTNTDDRPYLDTKGRFISGASFKTTSNPRLRNVIKGRIENGVLTTPAADVVLTQRFGLGGERGKKLEFDLRRARMRLHFKPDGSLEGRLGAYQIPRKVIQIQMLGGVGSAVVAGIDCATQLYTMQQLADGLRNPATGKCEGISSSLQVAAVPAFVNDGLANSASTAAK